MIKLIFAIVLLFLFAFVCGRLYELQEPWHFNRFIIAAAWAAAITWLFCNWNK